jgi:hypothetical protein
MRKSPGFWISHVSPGGGSGGGRRIGGGSGGGRIVGILSGGGSRVLSLSVKVVAGGSWLVGGGSGGGFSAGNESGGGSGATAKSVLFDVGKRCVIFCEGTLHFILLSPEYCLIDFLFFCYLSSR